MNRIHLCFAAALAVGFGASPAYAEILIGSATPVTGKMAWFGEQHQRAVELAVSELNAAGGILGEAVEVVAVIQVWRRPSSEPAHSRPARLQRPFIPPSSTRSSAASASTRTAT